MELRAVPPETMRAAQVVTGAAMALWLALGYVPALRRHVVAARATLLGLYLILGAVLLLRAMLP